ncbi:piggyBac transposable element-derived protein 4-like [Ischnura elegans]|uniref:piggyBac transposable element-derived protein 4-like n=1 Tax=Ischnura elegans TaxID=197161 RepID=UPI001ED8ACAA|nr:piggyBac transposable element-derived protein 4-like [Ischnura elegans]
MSRKRFHFILQSLRFDDKATRSDRKLLDKLAPVREVFDIFVQNCRESYSLGEYVTIDEMLSKFRGRCAFRQYIPSKPGKYGIKIFSLADSKTFYTGNLEVYVGKQPEGPFYVSNSANDVVKRLVRPIAHSGRNITADNWFTSYELVLDLLKANLTYVGTVRKNKRQLPPSFTSPVGREPFTTRFGFDRHCTLVSYIPKPRKNVILISSMHHDSTIDETTGNSNKPEIVTFYNATKSGVDVVDKLCATYSVARNTKRWPMTIFYTMLNVAAINAQVIYLVNNKESSHAILKRRHFIKVLAQELTKEHLQKRSHVVNLPRELRKRTLAISEKDKETEHNESSTQVRQTDAMKKRVLSGEGMYEAVLEGRMVQKRRGRARRRIGCLDRMTRNLPHCELLRRTAARGPLARPPLTPAPTLVTIKPSSPARDRGRPLPTAADPWKILEENPPPSLSLGKASGDNDGL